MSTPSLWDLSKLPNADDYNTLVQFLRRGVQPPSMLYLTRDDQLLLEMFQPLNSNTVTVHVRTMDPDGTITPQVFQMTGPSNGATATAQVIQGVEGYLLSVNISCPAPLRGQAFVRLRVQRGQGSQDITRGALICQGYVCTDEDLAYPPSRPFSSLEGRGAIRVQLGSTPAPGADFSDTVPSGVHWILRCVQFTYVASAAVATRFPHLTIDDGANLIWRGLPGSNVTAGQTFGCSFASGNTIFSNAANNFIAPLPNEFRIKANFRIRSNTTAIQGADQISAIVYYVEEFISNG